MHSPGSTCRTWVPGIVITVMVGLVLIGGLKWIAHTAEAIVPTMIVIYIGTGFAYILLNASELPTVFGLIFREAFTPTAALGGFIGSSVAQTIAAGVSRGVLFGTLLNGFMALPNLIGLAFLLPVVRKITRDYFDHGAREYSVAHPTTGTRVA